MKTDRDLFLRNHCPWISISDDQLGLSSIVSSYSYRRGYVVPVFKVIVLQTRGRISGPHPRTKIMGHCYCSDKIKMVLS